MRTSPSSRSCRSGRRSPSGTSSNCTPSAGIQLRVLPNLWSFWDAVTASTLRFSGIRLHNALPR